MYRTFALEHSRKWSSGKLPLSGGRAGRPFAGTDANDAIESERARKRGELVSRGQEREESPPRQQAQRDLVIPDPYITCPF